MNHLSINNRELGLISDVLTVEIEHVNADILQEMESKGHIVHPSSRAIRLIQDKYNQKLHLEKFSIPLPDFMDIPNVDIAYSAGEKFGYPFLLKNKRLAYDGRGNAVVKSKEEVTSAYTRLGATEIYAEKFVPFTKELAMMVVKTCNGIVCYPLVETIQQNNICHSVIAPAQQISSLSIQRANEICSLAIESLDSSSFGIYGIELFILADGNILLNEIAPRPHNSGHYTMEACDIDQFEMHLRAILSLPCPKPIMKAPIACMINILGEDSMDETKSLLKKAMTLPNVGIHWYGKSESRKGRKMAHFTITSSSIMDLSQSLLKLDLDPKDYNIDYIENNKSPLVGIIMGSDSDLDTMKDAAEILDQFKIPYELTIVSAHRTPTRMYSYAQSAVERGLKVIIAGAGGAAHLPGMVAALTSLPVIGVPVKTSTLNGQDSLLSIVQMPRGIPVATVAIGNASNAGLLAVRILGSHIDSLNLEMISYMDKQEEEVLNKAAKLENIGYASYLSKK